MIGSCEYVEDDWTDHFAAAEQLIREPKSLFVPIIQTEEAKLVVHIDCGVKS